VRRALTAGTFSDRDRLTSALRSFFWSTFWMSGTSTGPVTGTDRPYRSAWLMVPFTFAL